MKHIPGTQMRELLGQGLPSSFWRVAAGGPLGADHGHLRQVWGHHRCWTPLCCALAALPSTEGPVSAILTQSTERDELVLQQVRCRSSPVMRKRQTDNPREPGVAEMLVLDAVTPAD